MRQLALQLGRRERREYLGRWQWERCTASLLEKPKGLEELPEPLAVGEGLQWGEKVACGTGDWQMGWGAWKLRNTQKPWLWDAYPRTFPLQLQHSKYSPQVDNAPISSLHWFMEQEKPGSAGWNGDTRCNSKGVWGGRVLKESLSAGELVGLYTAWPVLPSLPVFWFLTY